MLHLIQQPISTRQSLTVNQRLCRYRRRNVSKSPNSVRNYHGGTIIIQKVPKIRRDARARGLNTHTRTHTYNTHTRHTTHDEPNHAVKAMTKLPSGSTSLHRRDDMHRTRLSSPRTPLIGHVSMELLLQTALTTPDPYMPVKDCPIQGEKMGISLYGVGSPGDFEPKP